MDIALILVGIAVVVLTAEAVSERLNVPPPLMLIAVGAAASYLPFLPQIHLEPEIVLLGLLLVALGSVLLRRRAPGSVRRA